MPIPRYGEAVRHAAMVALDGAVQASKALPEKVPGCTVAAALALIVASACARVSVESRITATPKAARTTRLRCSGAIVRMKTFSGPDGRGRPTQSKIKGTGYGRTADLRCRTA